MQMKIKTMSREEFERDGVPYRSVLIQMADPGLPFAKHRSTSGCLVHCGRNFHDVDDGDNVLTTPALEDIKAILSSIQSGLKMNADYLVVQCEAGIGRSRAVAAAAYGVMDNRPARRTMLAHCTHNRLLDDMIRKAAGLPAEPEPKVSIVVRVKYPIHYLKAFILSMVHQRYRNWELVVVTDGPNSLAKLVVASAKLDYGDKFKFVETETPLGRWGHPYRQEGIDVATGEIIGLQNDDNYLTPCYLEAMTNPIAWGQTNLTMCRMLHRYAGWGVVAGEPVVGSADVGNWLATRELIDAEPWRGVDFTSDGQYVVILSKATKLPIVKIDRPLLVKN